MPTATQCWFNGLGIAAVGVWGTVTSNIAQKLIEAHQLIYFRQPPLRQYLVSGCPYSSINTGDNWDL